MGGAMAKGMALGGVVAPAEITVADPSAETLHRIQAYHPELRVNTSNRAAVAGADLIILAVKPWLMEEVVADLKNGLDYTTQQIASVVAGVTFEQMRAMLENGSGVAPTLFRVIPNTAISQSQSVTFIASERATQEQQQQLLDLFSPLGLTLPVEESQMAAGTSLASCGIAFALKYMAVAMQGGVELGFTPEEARTVVMQTVRGALTMLEANGTMPQTEIDRVTTPGGITLKGLAAMKEEHFEEAVLAGLFKSR